MIHDIADLHGNWNPPSQDSIDFYEKVRIDYSSDLKVVDSKNPNLGVGYVQHVDEAGVAVSFPKFPPQKDENGFFSYSYYADDTHGGDNGLRIVNE